MNQETKRNYQLNRDKFLKEVSETSLWDFVVIGGGATGLGVALDAASRGFKTLLLEQHDFAKGTSSRSTKLVHGGVRYLAQGNIRLVLEALRERGRLQRNAPHLVQEQSFVIPCYTILDKLFYGLGLKMYDWLAGSYRFPKTAWLSPSQVLKLLPTIKGIKLQGGIEYFDGQFDDARLAINLAQTCAEQGGTLLNYIKVTSLLKDEAGKVSGVKALDVESNQVFSLKSKVIINATGVFVNEIMQLDTPGAAPLVRYSQGVHLVLDKTFLPGASALMIPKTPDGRVLFAVPWHEHLLVGTTDTPIEENNLEPIALDAEIKFILETAGQYLVRKPTRSNVLSVFAGLRPLAVPNHHSNSTKEISRSHKLVVTSSGLITITGGKWTTYRQMAEDTVTAALLAGGLPAQKCVTAGLKIHGSGKLAADNDPLKIYGSDAPEIRKLAEKELGLGQKLHEKFPYIIAEVIWVIRYEMARTVEDVLARRLRLLFLDARAAMAVAPKVARILAAELGHDADWIQKQEREFAQVANNYRLTPERFTISDSY
ncbi:glycerol-3-phosphate dehydrogenase/oxidase [Adhaeribacter aquaticus]|uniref:glycerol-3-phosphate dehydrogenase/oxidase n=1 Tax=Adhaeribacter aquaticus TaxID=299567 RepID=UPI0003F52D18|nr:glycerol-3-phosphate dehydrogenase/oxidase [Adhaeribacter aquaticus]